ncbi:hypothetical protein RUND412_003244 [Rhizina undulata]
MDHETRTNARRALKEPESVASDTILEIIDDIELDPAFDESVSEGDEEVGDINNERSDGDDQELEIEEDDEDDYEDDENDYEGYDYDSEYSNDDSRPIGSIPNIVDYEFENGRRYHSYKKGTYAMPNDEAEQERLDMMHHLYLLLQNGKLTFAPIGPDTNKVLDIGTGTGIWATDFADAHPQAQVIGTDLSPIQPSFVPPNLIFEVDDAESVDAFEEEAGTFDFIHIRNLAASIKDWPALIKRAYGYLRPNGYLEIVEHDLHAQSDDDTFQPTCALYRYLQNLNTISTAQGCVGWNSLNKFKTWMTEAGFVDVDEDLHKVPWGPWPNDKKQKELGKMVRVISESGMEAHALALLTRTNEYDPEKAKELIMEAKLDLKDRGVHVWNWHGFFIGRKPAEVNSREVSEAGDSENESNPNIQDAGSESEAGSKKDQEV